MSGNPSSNTYYDPSTNFFNYTNYYFSPSELSSSQSGVDITQAYTNSLFSGSTPNANKKQSLPGGRYFMDTNTTCSDYSGNTHPLSVLIDNVNTSQVNSFPGQGLLYSLLSSLTLFNPMETVDLSSICLPVSVYINDSSNAGMVTGYITSTQYQGIDPRAIGPVGINGKNGITGLSGSSGTSGGPSGPSGPSGGGGPSGPSGGGGPGGPSGGGGPSGPSGLSGGGPDGPSGLSGGGGPSGLSGGGPSGLSGGGPSGFSPMSAHRLSNGTTGATGTTGGTSNFCSSLSCDREDSITDIIVRTYLLALVILSSYIVYRAITRK
jgi:hypothetical protein